MSLKVLYEDNHIIAVLKVAGDLVQADKTEDETLADKVKAYIKKKFNKPGDVYLGIIHRLDRPVGGVIVFARTSKALVRMNKLFQDKQIQKTYWAIVESKPPEIEQTLIHYLKKNQEKNKSRGYDKEVKGSKRAELDYKLLGRSKNYYYGGKRTNRDGSIHLHARSISFIHPIQDKPLTISANPPSDPLWDEMLTLV